MSRAGATLRTALQPSVEVRRQALTAEIRRSHSDDADHHSNRPQLPLAQLHFFGCGHIGQNIPRYIRS